MALQAGQSFPDLALPDHTGRPRRLSEAAGGDPLVLVTSRGWWCPKEQRFLRGLVGLQDEFEVAYTRIVVMSVDTPPVQAAFRAGLGARFLFLSDHERRYFDELGLRDVAGGPLVCLANIDHDQRLARLHPLADLAHREHRHPFNR